MVLGCIRSEQEVRRLREYFQVFCDSAQWLLKFKGSAWSFGFPRPDSSGFLDKLRKIWLTLGDGLVERRRLEHPLQPEGRPSRRIRSTTAPGSFTRISAGGGSGSDREQRERQVSAGASLCVQESVGFLRSQSPRSWHTWSCRSQWPTMISSTMSAPWETFCTVYEFPAASCRRPSYCRRERQSKDMIG